MFVIVVTLASLLTLSVSQAIAQDTRHASDRRGAHRRADEP